MLILIIHVRTKTRKYLLTSLKPEALPVAANVTRKQRKRRTKKMARQHWFSNKAPRTPHKATIVMIAPKTIIAMPTLLK